MIVVRIGDIEHQAWVQRDILCPGRDHTFLQVFPYIFVVDDIGMRDAALSFEFPARVKIGHRLII
jgi:hypothetical protein